MRRSRAECAVVCLAVLLAGAFVGAGCAARSVNDVMADPGRYRNRDVNVAGEVTESVGVLGKGFFKLQDESGSLWVYTSRGLPRKGARVSSRGTIRDLASIDSVPDSDPSGRGQRAPAGRKRQEGLVTAAR